MAKRYSYILGEQARMRIEHENKVKQNSIKKYIY